MLHPQLVKAGRWVWLALPHKGLLLLPTHVGWQLLLLLLPGLLLSCFIQQRLLHRCPRQHVREACQCTQHLLLRLLLGRLPPSCRWRGLAHVRQP